MAMERWRETIIDVGGVGGRVIPGIWTPRALLLAKAMALGFLLKAIPQNYKLQHASKQILTQLSSEFGQRGYDKHETCCWGLRLSFHPFFRLTHWIAINMKMKLKVERCISWLKWHDGRGPSM